MDTNQITRDDEIIIVIGPTGAGKSTFINHALGGDGRGIGHDLFPCTQEIIIYKKRLGNPPRSIAFVDTPGLDKTGSIDWSVKLTPIVFRYKTGFRIGKLLYMHRLSDNRATPEPNAALRAVISGCSGVTLPGSAIVATMQSLVKGQVRQRRLTELKAMAESIPPPGAQLVEFMDTTESAWKIALGQNDSSNGGLKAPTSNATTAGASAGSTKRGNSLKNRPQLSTSGTEQPHGDPEVGKGSGPPNKPSGTSQPPKTQKPPPAASNPAKSLKEPSAAPLHPSTTKKIDDIRRDLKALHLTMKEEISRLKDIQATILQQEENLREQNGIISFCEEKITELKKEKDELPKPNVSVPHPSVLETLKEEHKHNKQRFDEQIKRWEVLSSKSKEDISSLTEKQTSNRGRLNATRENLIVHDEMRKYMVSALEGIESRIRRSQTEDQLGAVLADIETSLTDDETEGSESSGEEGET
ncbi:hypothetical protein FRC14_000238 [Serendipita sp. 396]|nr:hypothetical protein FRC14_000238 [Serendipita sp. 396]KAG8786870.1 hypothetical protein FRC15_010522 [Serendipita sp. 397]KAG8864356.1 hypothetical protein FRC20_010310 [Serendipita sp. 405]